MAETTHDSLLRALPIDVSQAHHVPSSCGSQLPRAKGQRAWLSLQGDPVSTLQVARVEFSLKSSATPLYALIRDQVAILFQPSRVGSHVLHPSNITFIIILVLFPCRDLIL